MTEEGRGLELLEADLAELDNSIYHLVRSNVELAQVLSWYWSLVVDFEQAVCATYCERFISVSWLEMLLIDEHGLWGMERSRCH